MYTPRLQVFAGNFAPFLQEPDKFASADYLARFLRAKFPCKDPPVVVDAREVRFASFFYHALLEYGSTIRFMYAAFPQIYEASCP
jgi:hypothetical protein